MVATVGATVAPAVGPTLRVAVGVAVGAAVGIAVRATVGVAVRGAVGVAVRAAVGIAVRATVGDAVGLTSLLSSMGKLKSSSMSGQGASHVSLISPRSSFLEIYSRANKSSWIGPNYCSRTGHVSSASMGLRWQA